MICAPFFEASRQLQGQDSGQLLDRLLVVIGAKIDRPVIQAEVAPLVAHHQDRRGLLAAHIADGRCHGAGATSLNKG